MPFKFETCSLDGVALITPHVFRDARGHFLETYKASEFHAAGIRERFVQDNCSVSDHGVLRGLHYQLPPRAQGKLVSVLVGEVWDVCVDIRRKSPTYGQWFAATLSDKNSQMLYVPPGFGHGFVVLSTSACVAYKCTQEYDPVYERGVRYDDGALAIPWPLRRVTVSARDAALPPLSEAAVFEEHRP